MKSEPHRFARHSAGLSVLEETFAQSKRAETSKLDETIYSQYFQVFAELYSRRLTRAQELGEIVPGDAEVRAWCLIGISNFLGMRYARWKRPPSMEKVVDTAFDLITHGLAPR